MGSGWGQSFSYDGFGNLTNVSTTAGSTPNLSVTYDYATNRRTSDCADGSGNISPCGTPYTFDAANRITLAAGYHYSYDSGNRRVWRGNGTTDELTYYSASGAKLCVYNLATSGSDLHATSTGNFEYFAGKMLKNSGGWINSDRLGSVGKYFPYGQDRGSSNPSNGTEKFATYKRDAETGLDYAVNRYEAPGDGRFLSVDAGSPNPSDPGSWNRYSYTRGDPVNRLDPGGLLDFDAGWFMAHMAELESMVPDGQCMILAMAASSGNDSAAAEFASGCISGQQAPMMDAQGAYCAGLAALPMGKGSGSNPVCELPEVPTFTVDTSPKCPADKVEFYKNYDIYKAMAKDLDTDIDFLLALSARETGYGTSTAFRNGNLFGASDAKEKPLSYGGSFQASAKAWEERWGRDVRGVTDAHTFFQNLVKDHYNPHPGYVDSLTSQVADTKKWTAICVPPDKR